MDLDSTHQVAGPTEVTPVIDFDGVSKWYGNVIGLNKLTLRIPPGVTGLLGPSQGTVRVLGHPVWNNTPLTRHVGLCPEQDAFYDWMTGFDFVRTCARLTGLGRSEASNAAKKAMATVGMTANMNRALRG